MQEKKLAIMKQLKEKLCKGNNSCNLTKSINEFHKRKASRDGYNGMCKMCVGKHKQIYKNKSINIEIEV